MATPQFGTPEPGRAYKDRPAAFGLALRDGRLACVRVSKPGHRPWIDLPGGAIDEGESAEQALVREFGEETGLIVRPQAEIGRADQFFINTDGVAFNNRATLFAAEITGEGAHLKIEDDHELVWLDPPEALRRLRHDAHAWAVAAFLRRAGRD
ncbi:MAG TPA: NUDIX domain-containing protein [Caulobacteraceae bacterium]|nr:NUDIX domain-containing protein [Caulobacteraceae bacterium]